MTVPPAVNIAPAAAEVAIGCGIVVVLETNVALMAAAVVLGIGAAELHSNGVH